MAKTRILFLTILLLIADQLTKWWAFTTLEFAAPRNLIGNVIRFTRVHNEGGAFGLFPAGSTVFLVVSSIISAILLLILLTVHLDSRWIRTGMACVLAGAVGNLVDRIRWGYVLDFFEIRGFPIFNVADACITIGAGLIILAVLFGGERHRSRRETDRV